MTTTSQRPRRSVLSTPIRRALTRSLHAVRDVHREQVYAWEAFWRSCRAPQGPSQTRAPAHSTDAMASAHPTAPTDMGKGDLAA
jgi:hypothetical protein